VVGTFAAAGDVVGRLGGAFDGDGGALGPGGGFASAGVATSVASGSANGFGAETCVRPSSSSSSP
jgi:hypothetical protein